jgi:hypothetical protein
VAVQSAQPAVLVKSAAPTQSPTPTATAAATEGDFMPGDLATVSANNLTCYPSADELDAALKAVAYKDRVGYREHTEGVAIFLRSGQHVRIIDMGGAMGAADRQLRIESGQDKDAACWVSADDAHFFKDIHEDK